MTKPVITTRASKGSALTWTEGDTNLENLRDATISVSADSGSTQSIDLNGTINVEGGLGIDTSTSTGKVSVALTNSGLPVPYTGSVTAIDGTADTITLSSTMGLTMSMQISFTGANLSGSNITSGMTYYITNIDGMNSKIQINNMMSGAMDLNTVADTSGITFSASGGAGGGSSYKLQYTSSTGTVSWAAESTTPTTTNLSSLGDVMISMPANNGEVLTYDSSTSKWKNIAPSSGGIANVVEDTTPQLGGTLDANGNDIDMGTNTITDIKVGNWDTAYSWGNHASAGYLTTETYTGTVTSVSGTGSVSGLTLTGTVTGSGNLTLGGALANIPNTALTNSTITINGSAISLGGTVTTGTVTSVSGTGTVNGLSLSGSVTSSGSLTLGGTLDLTTAPAIGSTSANTGKFTNLTVTGTINTGGSNGTNGQVLQSTGTGVQWATASSGGFPIVSLKWSGTPVVTSAGAYTYKVPVTEIADTGSICTITNTYEFTLPTGTYLIIQEPLGIDTGGQNSTPYIDQKFMSVSGNPDFTGFGEFVFSASSASGRYYTWTTTKNLMTLTATTKYMLTIYDNGSYQYNLAYPKFITFIKLA